jgi:hypothetical protein
MFQKLCAAMASEALRTEVLPTDRHKDYLSEAHCGSTKRRANEKVYNYQNGHLHIKRGDCHANLGGYAYSPGWHNPRGKLNRGKYQ